MKTFTIQSNECLNRNIQAFYHADYQAGSDLNTRGTVENVICMLKNQFRDKSVTILQNAVEDLIAILETDLPQIQQQIGNNTLTVCVVARAKIETTYSDNQKFFRQTISNVVNKFGQMENGTHSIVRIANTKTTHMSKSGYGGDGPMPYPGITKDTCTISENVRGKDILLIDDLYTHGVNIDEDAIQALLDKGAHSVVFYAVGKTLKNH